MQHLVALTIPYFCNRYLHSISCRHSLPGKRHPSRYAKPKTRSVRSSEELQTEQIHLRASSRRPQTSSGVAQKKNIEDQGKP
jgi:hypothetical protein